MANRPWSDCGDDYLMMLVARYYFEYFVCGRLEGDVGSYGIKNLPPRTPHDEDASLSGATGLHKTIHGVLSSLQKTYHVPIKPSSS